MARWITHKVRAQPFFQAGLERLRKAYEQRRRAALMCSESRPEDCHRSKLIGEALTAAGIPVRHIDEDGQVLTQKAGDRPAHSRADGFVRRALFHVAQTLRLACRWAGPRAALNAMSEPGLQLKFVSIGVYGFTADAFFQALQRVGVDTFCDIRWRRCVRGRDYAFANSGRLQRRLAEMSIRYLHLRELAPTPALRQRQAAADKAQGTTKRKRTALGEVFITGYREERLAPFDSRGFIQELGPASRVVALFCVEREPAACHRSLLAERLQQDLGVEVAHVTPE